MDIDVSRVSRKCSICDTQHDRKHRYCLSCHNAYMRDFRKSRPLSAEQKRKDSCRSYANVYLKRGKISKEPCALCASTQAQMHHSDYSQPLLVTWLCRPCHLHHHAHEAA